MYRNPERPPNAPALPHELSLDQVKAIAAATASGEHSDREHTAAAREARLDQDHATRARIASLREDLAKDLGVPSSGLTAALNARAESRGPTAPIWTALRHIETPDQLGADPIRVIEARHVLAAIGAIPKVRDGSPFGAAKAIREFPRAVTDPPSNVDVSMWFERLVELLGAELPERPRINFETADESRRRVAENRRLRRYDPQSEDNDRALAERELELLAQERAKLEAAAREQHRAALAKLRGELVALVDASLVELKLNAAWWHARRVRAQLAGERRPAGAGDPIEHFYTAAALGWSTVPR